MRKRGPFTLFLCIIIFLYLIIAPFYLFSLEREDLDRNKKEDKLDWKGVITLWDIPRPTTAGSSFGWIRGRINAFEKKHPNVLIDLRELIHENREETVLKALEEGEGPDILPLFVDQNPIPLQHIKPLDQWMNPGVTNGVKKEALQVATYQNKVYGVPFSMMGNVLILNTDLLQKIGCKIPKKESWNYQEFINLLQSIEKAKGEEEVFSFDAYLGKGEGSLIPILLADGGAVYQQEEQRFAFYQPEMISGLQKLLNIKLKGNTQGEFGARSKGDVYKDFLEEQKTAVLAADSNIIYVLERLKKNGEGFAYQVMPFPVGNMDIPIWYSHQTSVYSIVKKQEEDPAKQEILEEFLAFLLEEESQQSLKSLGAFPTNDNGKGLYDEDSLINEWYNRGYEYQSYPLHPQWSEIEDKMIESIKAVLTGAKSPTESFKDLQDQVESFK